jgi:hypothetical protein
MVIPTILPQTKAQHGIKFYKAPPGEKPIPGVKPEGDKPQSFLMKYWYVILPFALMTFMGSEGPQEAAPVAGASAGGAPNVVGGAPATAQAAAASAGDATTKPRRGKRS